MAHTGDGTKEWICIKIKAGFVPSKSLWKRHENSLQLESWTNVSFVLVIFFSFYFAINQLVKLMAQFDWLFRKFHTTSKDYRGVKNLFLQSGRVMLLSITVCSALRDITGDIQIPGTTLKCQRRQCCVQKNSEQLESVRREELWLMPVVCASQGFQGHNTMAM